MPVRGLGLRSQAWLAEGVSHALAVPRSAGPVRGHLSFLEEISELSLTGKCTCLHGDILFVFLSM